VSRLTGLEKLWPGLPSTARGRRQLWQPCEL